MSDRQRLLLDALKAAQQFLSPEISRGPAIDGWHNTVEMVTEAIAAAEAALAAGTVPHPETIRHMIAAEESKARPRPAYLRALRDVAVRWSGGTVPSPPPPQEFSRVFDNHHNALTCPYCNPQQLVLIDPKRLRELSVDDAARVAPLSAGADGQDLPRSDNAVQSPLTRPRLATEPKSSMELLQATLDATRRERDRAEAQHKAVLALALTQAEDDGLWFIARTASEAYLQAALRRLHAVIETGQVEKTYDNPSDH